MTLWAAFFNMTEVGKSGTVSVKAGGGVEVAFTHNNTKVNANTDPVLIIEIIN